MRQRKQTTAREAANDNARIGAAVENTAHLESAPHVYLEKPKISPTSPTFPESRTRIRATWEPTRIITNLPEKLPILPEEVALIRGFMGELVSSILANDNEPA